MILHLGPDRCETILKIEKQDGFVVITTAYHEVRLLPSVEEDTPSENNALEYLYEVTIQIARSGKGILLSTAEKSVLVEEVEVRSVT